MMSTRNRQQPLVMFGFGYSAPMASLAVGIAISQIPAFEATMQRMMFVPVSRCLVAALVVLSSVDMIGNSSRLPFTKPSTTPDIISREETITRRCDELSDEHRLTTNREHGVMRLIVLGRLKGYIAEELLISENDIN